MNIYLAISNVCTFCLGFWCSMKFYSYALKRFLKEKIEEMEETFENELEKEKKRYD